MNIEQMNSVNNSSNKNRWVILYILVMLIFMGTLDSSIVNVALPVMAKSLNVTSTGIQLVVTSYLVIISATILIFGRLGDIVGKTKVVKFGAAIFTLGSLSCGITSSLEVLILARVIQAIGAAACMATAQGIVNEVFPRNERGKAVGITGTFMALGALVRPPLGGVIVAATSWRYIFLINVPIGTIVLVYCLRIFPKEHKIAKGKFDVLGSLLSMFVIVPLFLAISKGEEIGFDKPIVSLGFLISIVSLITFIMVERKHENPLLQLQIFKNKVFSVSTFCGFISYVSIFCSVIIQPFYLQDVLKFSPAYTGLILMIYPLIMSVISPASGHMADKISSEILIFIGLVISSLGLLLMSTLNENSSIISMVFFIVIMSIGNGLYQSPITSLIMSAVPRNKLGIAGSVNALTRNLGTACGIALSTIILYNRMSYKIGHQVTDYVVGRNDAFIYGMRSVHITAAVICMIGAILIALRLFGRNNKIANSLELEKSEEFN